MKNENVNMNNEPDAMTEDVMTEATPEMVSEPAPMIDVASAVDTIVARSEATQIIVNIINAFLNVHQKSENKISNEELAAIQNAINEESAKTDALFAAVNAAVNPEVAPAPVDSEADTEATEDTSSN